MWSGPRNISTAMMRSFGNRADTWVIDEPFYAYFLSKTGKKHPGAEDVLEVHETDYARIVATLTGPIPHGRRIFYQKQMAHHLLRGDDVSWIGDVVNVFLIRDPKEMLASLFLRFPEAELVDTGLQQQVALFDRLSDMTGIAPPVIDARDVLSHPEAMLTRLCQTLAIPFDEAMLSWPPGRRDTDGIWAEHWYDNVERSTGFAPYRPKEVALPDAAAEIYDECHRLYDRLYAHRLTASV